MQPEDRIRLQHMIDATQAAQNFLSGRHRSDLDTDQMLCFAVVRAIEIIGEAAARTSPACRATISDLPWQAIIGMRNRMIHAYFDIDHEVVWQTVTSELPLLLNILKNVLAQV